MIPFKKEYEIKYRWLLVIGETLIIVFFVYQVITGIEKLFDMPIQNILFPFLILVVAICDFYFRVKLFLVRKKELIPDYSPQNTKIEFKNVYI